MQAPNDPVEQGVYLVARPYLWPYARTEPAIHKTKVTTFTLLMLLQHLFLRFRNTAFCLTVNKIRV